MGRPGLPPAGVGHGAGAAVLGGRRRYGGRGLIGGAGVKESGPGVRRVFWLWSCGHASAGCLQGSTHLHFRDMEHNAHESHSEKPTPAPPRHGKGGKVPHMHSVLAG